MNDQRVPAPAPGAGAHPGGPEPAGCLSTAGWFGAACVLPAFSLNFYSHAVRRRTWTAVAFFFLFALVITALQTLSFARTMTRAGLDMRRAFETGSFPEITISNGTAQVNGPQPFVLVDEEGTLVVLDTTGQVTAIDRRRYSQGLLLTRTTLVALNRRGEYQEIPLRDLQAMLETDPIVINAETATAYWAAFSGIIGVIAAVSLLLWNTVVRLAYVALLGLLVWGLAALIRRGTDFGPVLSVGLYALVPALFIDFLLSQVRFDVPGTTTFLLILFWAVGLAAAFQPRLAGPAPTSVAAYFRAERPLRGWRALIALPLLAAVALEMIFHWRAWYVTWGLAFFTAAALLAVSAWPLVVAGDDRGALAS